MGKKIVDLNSYFSGLGKKSGKARAEKLSVTRRREIAKKAIETRWAKARKAASDGR